MLTIPASLFLVGFARLRSISLLLENTRVLPLGSRALFSPSSIVSELENIPSSDSIESAIEPSFAYVCVCMSNRVIEGVAEGCPSLPWYLSILPAL